MTHPSTPPQDLPWYRSETWLAVELSAFVPIALAFLLPAFQLPLFGAGALLSVTGLAMLIFRKPTQSARPVPERES